MGSTRKGKRQMSGLNVHTVLEIANIVTNVLGIVINIVSIVKNNKKK